jgi:soluble lytic murein transglycosylase-like protein
LRSLSRLSFAGVALVFLIAAVRDRSVDTTPQAPELLPVPAVFEPPAAGREGDPGAVRLERGFAAHASGDMATAVELLRTPVGGQAQLEDWRLFVLAESAHALGDDTTPQEALAALVGEHPGSPIRAIAIQRATEIAVENESWQEALDWVDLSRGEDLPQTQISAIEALLWEMGQTLDDRELKIDAGRRLLVEDPLLATELGVDRLFQGSSGEIDWSTVLDHSELERRAQNLIDGKAPEAALETLGLVPETQRAFSWSLLRAQALTRDYRGREALEVLASLDSSAPDDQVELLWQRALAARDASQARRGRANLSESQRREMARRSAGYLEEIVAVTEDQDLQRRALQLLFAQVSDRDDSFDESLALMQRLKRLEPSDTTGARYLWRHGWQAYAKRNYPGAIGYWSELHALYPDTNPARSGRYWTGRSHEALEHGSRAQDIYREIISAGVDDFYSQHARSRLSPAEASSLAPPDSPTEPWPEDRVLDRARWISDQGLHRFALYEVDALRGSANPRAFNAQRAVILARNDERRESIQELARAFPALGKAHQTTVPIDALRLYYPLDYRPIIEQRAAEQGLPPYLVFAMIRQESAFDASARSWAGAQGLMQLMPATGREVAQRLGLQFSTSNLNDPDFSVRLGTRYFKQVLEMFDGNHVLALAGYNGGPYRIKKLWRQAGSNPELDRFVDGLGLEETKNYVKRIVLFQDSYERLYSAGS